MPDSVFIYLFIFKAIAVPISFALLYLPSLLYEYIVDAVSILRKLAFVLSFKFTQPDEMFACQRTKINLQIVFRGIWPQSQASIYLKSIFFTNNFTSLHP